MHSSDPVNRFDQQLHSALRKALEAVSRAEQEAHVE
jgi:hypothetical protein